MNAGYRLGQMLCPGMIIESFSSRKLKIKLGCGSFDESYVVDNTSG